MLVTSAYLALTIHISRFNHHVHGLSVFTLSDARLMLPFNVFGIQLLSLSLFGPTFLFNLRKR